MSPRVHTKEQMVALEAATARFRNKEEFEFGFRRGFLAGLLVGIVLTALFFGCLWAII